MCFRVTNNQPDELTGVQTFVVEFDTREAARLHMDGIALAVVSEPARNLSDIFLKWHYIARRYELQRSVKPLP